MKSENATPLSPEAVRRALPVSREAELTVHAARRSLQAVRDGHDERTALVIGPRTVRDPESAFDYARRLRRLAEGLSDEHLVLMRLRVEDLVNDPQRNGSHDPNLGLATARQVLLRINELGLPCAADPSGFAAPYLSDLIVSGLDVSDLVVSDLVASPDPVPEGGEPEGGEALTSGASRGAVQVADSA